MDCLEPGVWRLEVMPDAVVVNDPFAKPSLNKEVVTIAYGAWDMALQIPDLGMEFTFTALNQGNQQKGNDRRHISRYTFSSDFHSGVRGGSHRWSS